MAVQQFGAIKSFNFPTWRRSSSAGLVCIASSNFSMKTSRVYLDSPNWRLCTVTWESSLTTSHVRKRDATALMWPNWCLVQFCLPRKPTTIIFLPFESASSADYCHMDTNLIHLVASTSLSDLAWILFLVTKNEIQNNLLRCYRIRRYAQVV